MKTIYQTEKLKDLGEGKSVKYTYAFKEPNREEKQKMSIFYSKTLFDLLKQGMPSVNMLDKLHEDNVGGVLSEKEHREFKELQAKLFELQKAFEKIDLNKKDAKVLEESRGIVEKINTIRTRMNELQMQKDSIYNNTAEIFARNKTIEKLILDMSYFKTEDVEAEFQPMFGEGAYEDKLDILESKASDLNDDQAEISTMFAVATLYWIHGITDKNTITEVLDGVEPKKQVEPAEEVGEVEEVQKKGRKKKAAAEQEDSEGEER
jgi:hypothetical protein